MITAWDVYVITRLDVLLNAFVFMLFVIGIGGAAISAFLYAWFCDLEMDVGRRLTVLFVMPFCLLSFFVGGIGYVVTPTTKEACAIYLLPKIANNEQVQKIPDNFAKLLNAKMEAWINETVKDEKK